MPRKSKTMNLLQHSKKVGKTQKYFLELLYLVSNLVCQIFFFIIASLFVKNSQVTVIMQITLSVGKILN